MPSEMQVYVKDGVPAQHKAKDEFMSLPEGSYRARPESIGAGVTEITHMRLDGRDVNMRLHDKMYVPLRSFEEAVSDGRILVMSR